MIGAGFEARLSETIVQEMWEKWVFLATLAGSTCLMRAAIGDILAAPKGQETIQALYDECRAIATANGHAPREPSIEQSRTHLNTIGSTLTASMLRDIEKGGAIEADHIVGDLIARRAGSAPDFSVLELAYTHMKAYEARRARTSAGH
jgi:2-dehydropantoate 2-reductase